MRSVRYVAMCSATVTPIGQGAGTTRQRQPGMATVLKGARS